jgi:hypothetical protein
MGFDPLNVSLVEGGLLHTRFLKLGNDDGAIEAIETPTADVDVLTISAGAHPLFGGVSEAVWTGLAEPAIERSGDAVSVRAPGIEARFRRASVVLGEREIVLRLASAPR